MRFSFVVAILARLNLFVGASMLAPMVCALAYGEGSWRAFAPVATVWR